MFTTISIHIVNESKFDTAIDTFTKNTHLARKQKGFISRQILVTPKDGNKIPTVTNWETKEDIEAWAKNPQRPKSPPGTYASVESIVYQDTPVA